MAYVGNKPSELAIQLDDATVTTAKLANDAVTAAKIVDGTIVADDLNAGIITNAKVNASAAIAATKIAISGGANITLQSDGTFDLDNTINLTGGLQIGGTGIIDSSRNISNINNADIDGTLNVQGETTLQTHLNMGDNDKIKLGNSADLLIYHDANDSYIEENGSGNLILSTNGTHIQLQASNGEPMVKGIKDGATELYHDNSKKFETTSSGVTVTGSLLTTNIYGVNDGNTGIQFEGSDVLTFHTGGAENIQLTSNAIVFNQDSVDMDFRVESNGVTAMLFVDGGNNRVGIGTDSPSQSLHVKGNIEVEGDTSGVSKIRFKAEETHGEVEGINSGNNFGGLAFKTNSNGTVAERMRIESNGNVSIGNTNPNSFNSQGRNLVVGTGTGTDGMTIFSGSSSYGNIFFADGTSGSDPVRGGINYNHINNSMNFRVNDSPRMYIDSSGRVLIGTTTEGASGADDLTIASTSHTGITLRAGTSSSSAVYFSDGTSGTDEYDGYVSYNHASRTMVQLAGINYGVNIDGANRVFKITDAGTERLRVDSSGSVGIGVTPEATFAQKKTLRLSATASLIAGGAYYPYPYYVANNLYYDSSDNLKYIASSGGAMMSVNAHLGGRFQFFTAPSGTANGTANITERMRITTNGDVLVGTTDTNVADNSGSARGINLRSTTNDNNVMVAVYQNTVLHLNRLNNDGTIVDLRQNGTVEGTISVSGNTVSYNAFSGSHWSRLKDNSKPTILKGTIIETIDEMCDWYQVEFTIPKTEEADAITKKVSYSLQDGQNVGDTITYNYNDTDYQATIIKEADNKHTKCKISDTADSKRVYGVHASWDNDNDTINDMYVTAIGTHVVRINKDVTVSAGDLLSSNGDGTAKVQGDDIIRSKTIGKVLTNLKQETYSDGSYTVPCALYCG